MSESDSRMSKSYIKQILEATEQLNHLVDPEQDLEDWVDAKIARARNDLMDVLGYLKYYTPEVVDTPSSSSPAQMLLANSLKQKARAIIAQIKKSK